MNERSEIDRKTRIFMGDFVFIRIVDVNARKPDGEYIA